jgi:predicted permease
MRWTLWRRRTADDFSDEVETHLAMETERLVRSGMSPGDAVNAARRAFGNVTAAREQFHEARMSASFERLVLDVRYALRAMRRAPGFTAAAILSLALGIGANATIFATINGLLLKRLPVVRPDELVMLRADDTGVEWSYASFSYTMFRNFREQAHGFSDVAAIGVLDRFNVSLDGPGGGLDPARTRVAIVSGNYFSLLGIGATRGRTIGATDDLVPGGHPVAVISYAYWRRRLSGAPDVVGRRLAFNGTAYDVIGVLPAVFSGDWVGRPIDIWVPMMMEAQVMTERPGLQSANFLRIVARLKPGVSLQQAERDAGPLQKRLSDEALGSQQRLSLVQRFGLAPAGGGFSPQRESYGTSLMILAVAVALVLLIACANVANLLLARSEARQQETALRLAMGAGAGRIARQLITESVVLAGIGGALGVLLSVWATGVVGAVIGGGPIPVDSRSAAQPLSLSLHPDARVLAFAAGLTVLTAIAFGLAPALRGARAPLASVLTSRGEATGASGRRHRMTRLLVMLQVALSLPLLVGAGLFARSMQNLRAVDLGYDRQHTLLVWTSPGQKGRQGPELAVFAQTVVARMSALPGVQSASVANNGVLTGISDESGGRSENAKAEGSTPRPGVLGISLAVSPTYFETLGVHLVEGRLFTDADGTGPQRVAVINETMRRTLFADVDPIGRHYYLLPRDAAAQTQVVGVVSDVKWGSPRDRPRMIEYVPVSQGSARLNNMVVLVRAVGPAATIARQVRTELAAIDSGLPVIGIDTIEQQLDDVLAQDRLLAGLAMAAGLVVAILTSLGLYGVISYVTARRTREIGIRVALGATRSGLISMVMGESGKLVIAGIVLGVPVTLALTRYASTRLYNVSVGDPLYVAAAIALMLAVALGASLLPAWRASRVDPMDALRAE